MPVLGLLGDVMLGRAVADAMRSEGPSSVFSAGVVEVLDEADAVVANLECCISARGRRWPDCNKEFFFRAPPLAVDVLVQLGVSAVSLANNHALDYGYDALLDTLDLLQDAGIATTGAGVDAAAAHQPAHIRARDVALTIVGCADHPVEYGATGNRPGTAYAQLCDGIDPWLREVLCAEITAHGPGHCVVVTPHWGPNMVAAPIPRVRHAAEALVGAGATLVAGHSAHVFHGIAGRVLFDLGDVVDDYQVDTTLRNDLGALFLVELDHDGPREVAAVPIALDYCHTRLADADEAAWVRDRFAKSCAALGTPVCRRGDRMVVDLRSA